MKEKFTFLVAALLILTIVPSFLFAATTGKIAGLITDAETGDPLPAANIILEGTLLGGATDLNGNFVILNVRPGTYTVSISMMGYQAIKYENIRVSTGLTTIIDAALEVQLLETDAVVIVAQKELVTKDMTSSLSTISADQIESLPVTSVSQVLRLSAGIIESGGRLHIRGGRAGEVAYWIDGISTTDVYDGRVGVTVENSSIQELQVISGTFNAEYGQAMSGIVNIITKEGGADYNLQLKGYIGDYYSTNDIYSVYKDIEVEADPENGGVERVVSSKRSRPLEDFTPIYNGEMSFSGPLGPGNKLTFFTNNRYVENEGYFYGHRWYQANGLPGDSALVAMNPYQRKSFQGKLNLQLTSSLKLSYNFFTNKTYNFKNYYRTGGADYFQGFNTHDYKYVPDGIPQAYRTAKSHIATLNHVLSPSTFYELRVSRYESEYEQYAYKDPTNAIDYEARVLTQDDSLITVISDWENANDLIQEYLALGNKVEYHADRTIPNNTGYLDPGEINAPTNNSFMNDGMDPINVSRSTSYWIGKLDFVSQINKTHQLKFGGEARLHDLTLHAFQVVPKTDELGNEIEPFQPAIPEISSIYRSDYQREPKEFSAYIQDKVEYDDIIFNVGLRYDYFDPNAYIFSDKKDPNIYAPFKDEHIYKDLNNNGVIDETEEVPENEYTPDERRSFMQEKVDAKYSLSPRLGIAFPISNRGVIHFSYGHFMQIPEFQFLYTNPDYKITSGSGETVFGNPDLKPQKTVMYEIGLQQQISDDIGVDITLFYRDVRDWVGTSPFDTTYKTAVVYSRYVNKDYENVRGVTLKVEKRLSNNYSYRVDYTYQSAEGTYSNPTDAYNASLNNEAPVLALVPMSWDQKHTFNAQFIYDLNNWTISLIGRYWSGRPYTPSYPIAETTGAGTLAGLRTNSERRPDQKTVDLTINRKFQLTSGIGLEVFMSVYNLFDLQNATNVYADTGSPDYTTNTDPDRILYKADRVSSVEDFATQPSWYSAPREIQLGIILDF